MDKIIISGLRIYAYHGVNTDEKEKGQPFVLDITCHADLSVPCISDNVDDTVSYAQIVKLVKQVMNSKKNDLLESTAEQVTAAILGQYSSIEQVDLTLKKPRAPILADFDYVAIAISRKRSV